MSFIKSLFSSNLDLSAITTPHKLPWFAPKQSLQILLTPSEIHQPWTLYLAPGLMAARTLHVVWLTFVQRGVRYILLPSLSILPTDGSDGGLENIPPIRFGLYLIFIIASMFILVPLEVITVRLSVQRNHSGTGGFGAVPQDEDLPELEYAGRDEDVIALRPEDNPYTGFVHCAKSIVQEEGPEALMRAWWVTLIVSLLGMFS